MRKQATSASAHSDRLPMSGHDDVARFDALVRCSRPARHADARATSPKLHSRRPSSWPSSISAVASAGAASTTSRAKFTRQPRTNGSRVAPVSSTQIDFVSVNDLIASKPFSRPIPEKPKPPNGTA